MSKAFFPQMLQLRLLFWAYMSYSGFKCFFDNLSSVIEITEAEWYKEKSMVLELILNLAFSPSTFYRMAERL